MKSTGLILLLMSGCALSRIDTRNSRTPILLTAPPPRFAYDVIGHFSVPLENWRLYNDPWSPDFGDAVAAQVNAMRGDAAINVTLYEELTLGDYFLGCMTLNFGRHSTTTVQGDVIRFR